MATFTVQHQAISYPLTTATVVTFEPTPALSATLSGTFQGSATQGQQVTDVQVGAALSRLQTLGAIA